MSATNRGTITTRGGLLPTALRADGVQAVSNGGLARATNEAGGIIRTEGIGARGLSALNYLTDGKAEAENFGQITTTGDSSDASFVRLANGIEAWSETNSAYAVNHAGATVATSGRGARGVYAIANHGGAGESASAVNHGAVTINGGGFHNETVFYIGAGVRAYAGEGGLAQASNRYGGVIETTTAATGARGIAASAYGGGEAQATNSGRITTRGNAYIVDRDGTSNDTWYSAIGINAYADTADATVTNAASGVIATHGTAATGMAASSDGGNATAVNQGQITTHQTQVFEYDSSDASFVGLAHGVLALSENNSAYAVNDAGATVATSGRGARGVYAITNRGGAGESASAVNHGAVTINGGGFHNEAVFYIGVGVFASAGEGGLAQASNSYGGVIETTTAATGAFGIAASAYGGGEAQATNSGRITTRGNAYMVDRDGTSNDTWRSANGINAYADKADATATNAASGVIATHGTAATGMAASSDGGNATAVNQGQITTHQTQVFEYEGATFGAHGVYAYSSTAAAVVENDATGRVGTVGDWAVALLAITSADGSGASGAAEVRNKGQVVTVGQSAEGVLARATNGGTATNPNRVRAYNHLGAAIETSGDKAVGLGAVIQINGGGATAAVTAYGTALAQNSGTITTSGGSGSTGAGTFAANGVVAAYYVESGDTTTHVANAGNVTLINTGNVTVNGANATGLLAQTYGDGNAVISMTDGSVTAGAVGGTGIWAYVRDGASNTNSGDASISISGGNVSAVNGIGIRAQSGSGGTVTVMVTDSEINAVTAAHFSGGAAQFALSGSTLSGNVVFGAHSDMFTISDSTVNGNVDFGAGEDTLTFDVSSGNSGRITGDISNLETLVKRGAGDALVNNVAFSGSNVDIHEGRLVISGHLNVGANGTVTVNNGGANTGQLAALIASETNLPRITARLIDFTGNADIYMQAMNSELASLAQTVASGLLMNVPTIMSAGTATDAVTLRSQTSSGSSSAIGSIDVSGATRVATVSGTIAVDPVFGIASTPPPATSSGSSNNATGFIIGGGVLAALAYYFDWFDWASTEAASLSSHNGNTGGKLSSLGALTAGANTVHTRRAERNGLQFWSRIHSDNSPTFAGGSRATVRAYALGINAPLGDGFSIGVSAMPDMTASVSNAPGLYSGGISGDRYAINGAWQGERLFANVGFSYGDYNAHSVFDNAIGGGSLSGNFGMTHEHLRLGIGARLEIAGIRAVPRLSLFDGVAKQAAYRATGAVLYAEIPAIQQRYRGWKVGMSLSPSGWFGSSRTMLWRPNLHLSAIGSHSQGGVVSVRQSDANGILSFTSPARVSQMPRSILGFATSILAVRSDVWQLRVGYAGAIADDQLQHGAVASFRLRF